MSVTEVIREIGQITGFNVSPVNAVALEQHIAARMRARGWASEMEFVDALKSGRSGRADECRALAKVLTTHESFFMRDAGQMALLRQRILPELIAARRTSGELTLKVWSCGCASGEEPASIAILLRELLPDLANWRIQILATDVSSEILERAKRAAYGDWSFRGCDATFRLVNFQQLDAQWVLRPAIRQMIRYGRVDIIHDALPDQEQGLSDVDLILCRNVFIYFQPHAIRIATAKLAACMRAGAVLMTAHGELRQNCPRSLVLEMHPESAIFRKADPDRINTPSASYPAGADGRKPTPLPAKQDTPRSSTAGPTLARAPRAAPVAGDMQRSIVSHQSPLGLPDDTLERAWRLADEGKLDATLQACAQLLAEDQMNAGAHFLEAVIETELGNEKRARAALRRTLYLDPGLIAAHVHLERLQSAQTNIQSAHRTRDTIRKLVAALPADAPIPFMADTKASDLADQLDEGAAGRVSQPD